MDIKNRFYVTLSKFIPTSYKNKFLALMQYAGVDGDLYAYLGSVTLLSILIGAISGLYYWIYVDFFKYLAFVVGILGFFLTEYLYYIIFLFKADNRTKETEDILSDFLQLVSSNLRAGMTPFKALKTAAQFDFGPLSKEINKAIKESAGVGDFGISLLKISKRIQSPMVERSLQLFVTSLNSGGALAQLLEDLSADLTETMSLKKELLSSTKTYTMFILFTVLIGTPLLLAISINFIDTISSLKLFSGSGSAGSLAGIDISELEITPEFLSKISLGMLFMTTLLASLFLGVIREGKRSSGLRYTIPMFIVTLIIFFAIKGMIKGFV